MGAPSSPASRSRRGRSPTTRRPGVLAGGASAAGACAPSAAAALAAAGAAGDNAGTFERAGSAAAHALGAQSGGGLTPTLSARGVTPAAASAAAAAGVAANAAAAAAAGMDKSGVVNMLRRNRFTQTLVRGRLYNARAAQAATAATSSTPCDAASVEDMELSLKELERQRAQLFELLRALPSQPRGAAAVSTPRYAAGQRGGAHRSVPAVCRAPEAALSFTHPPPPLSPPSLPLLSPSTSRYAGRTPALCRALRRGAVKRRGFLQALHCPPSPPRRRGSRLVHCGD